MDLNERKVNISYDNIVAQVAAFLYATGAISHKEDILDIRFGDIENGFSLVNGKSLADHIVPLTIITRKEVSESKNGS